MNPDPPPAEPDPLTEAARVYERVLVCRCRAGDEAAFAELAARYHPRLTFFLRKMAGRADAVEDLLQEVWLDAYRGLNRLADPGAFGPWLYRIARARAARACRGRPDPDPLPDPDALHGPGAAGFEPDEVERVHAALDRINPAHREVLVLRFVEDMSYDEIAQATGSAPGTVRSRIHYAKRALRAALGDANHDRP